MGGGISGVATTAALAERGVSVTLLESSDRLGGRVAAWPLPDGRTMSRGFHAFFRQYYNLRALLRRIDSDLGFLIPVDDYPLQRPDGMRDSFTGLVRTPPWSVMQFVARSPAFTAKSLARVNVLAALELLRVRFPDTYSAYEGESAAAFLDRLQFPPLARDLALEVFARSFFADPRDFAAGELVAMFHTYFLGSAEGLLFDVPVDDYDTVLWAPLREYLEGLGVRVRTSTPVSGVHIDDDRVEVMLEGENVRADALVMAADPRSARRLLASTSLPQPWRHEVGRTVNAPPFVVVRQWLDLPLRADRPAFLGTAGYGLLDNISILDRFEKGAAAWAGEHGGAVVELHAYACEPEVATDAGTVERVLNSLVGELHRAYPEARDAGVVHQDVLVRDDCTLIGPSGWNRRPGVRTPSERLFLTGDWVRCDYPVALMERAATTGFMAANEILARWGVSGHDLWTVPMHGLLSSRSSPRGGDARHPSVTSQR